MNKSFTWRLGVVGSCLAQKTSSKVSKLHSFGSYWTRTTSEWLVVPEHTSSYVGLSKYPWVYPTSVFVTPGTRWNANSTPQKQPAPICANCWSGAGISSSGPWELEEEEEEYSAESVGERVARPSLLSQLILGGVKRVERRIAGIPGELKGLRKGNLGREETSGEEERAVEMMVNLGNISMGGKEKTWFGLGWGSYGAWIGATCWPVSVEKTGLCFLGP